MAVPTDLRTGIQTLIDKYRTLRMERGEHGLKELSEANVRKDFIDSLFRVLGWRTDDSREYDAESYVRGAGFADVATKLDSKPVIFIEAKRFGQVPSSVERGVQTTLTGYKIYADWTAEERQVLNYAGMSVGVKWAILTNFEKFRLFNAKTGTTILNIEKPEEYLDRLEDLFLLTKHNVAVGNLDKLETRIELPDIDLDFLNLLNDWRLKLSRNILTNCPGIELDKIKRIVQRILDRLIVIRYAEDKWILEDPDQLKSTYEIWVKTRIYQKLRLTGLLKGIFDGFDEKHDSKIFEADEEVDSVLEKVDSEVLGDIIIQLYNQSFRKFTSDILGNTYENYLGHELVLEDGELQIRPNQQLRKSGGIYYTRSYVVDYTVSKTVGAVLEEIWKLTERMFEEQRYDEARNCFLQIQQIKVLDPACGSGSFLIKAYHLFKSFYERYNELVKKTNDDISAKISELRKNGNNKDAWQLESTKLQKLENFEKDILRNNLYGVDIDPQAAEIASVNLVLQALRRGEKLPLILQENIKVGNSLISGADAEMHNYFKTSENEKPFDWESQFPKVFGEGGFHAVIGNPPHGAQLTKDERRFFGEKYKIAKGYRNTASLFIERAISILRENGYLGLVIPKSLTYSEKWSVAREFLRQESSVIELVDISKAFSKVLLEQVVVISRKTKETPHAYEGTRLFWNEPKVSLEIPFNLAIKTDALPIYIGRVEESIFGKVEKTCTSFGKMSRTFRGLPIQSHVTDERAKGSIPILRGDDIKPFYLAKPRTFVDKAVVDWDSDKVKAMQKPKLISQRIVAHVLRPRDHIIIMSTLDLDGMLSVDTVENTIVTDKDYDSRYVLAFLNSKFVSWFAYTFIFNRAVRTMDLDDYYVAKIPIFPADRKTQDRIGESVDVLLKLTNNYFSNRPSFQEYIGKLPRTKNDKFRHWYNQIPMSKKSVGLPSTMEGTIKQANARQENGDLIVSVRYLEEGEEEEQETEIIKATLDDPLLLAFLTEAVNISSVSKSRGNILEKVLSISIPRFKAKEAENLKEIHRLMREYLKDMATLTEVTKKIQEQQDFIDKTIYSLIGLMEEEVETIERQVSDGIYSEKS